ncbi:MAG: 16S rRNA (uracil(1498)-N(3))-methyltransferase [Desulfobacterales bacterium]|nr:16S rRNA (uracil(1498)-N(3))-methyltransferase [Desulfobacterales bacterium]
MEKAFTRDDLISHRVIADKEWACYVYKKPDKGVRDDPPDLLSPIPEENSDHRRWPMTRSVTLRTCPEAVARRRSPVLRRDGLGVPWRHRATRGPRRRHPDRRQAAHSPRDPRAHHPGPGPPEGRQDGVHRPEGHGAGRGPRDPLPLLRGRIPRRTEDRAAKRLERWRRIASEAAEQCGQADVPEITETRSFR